MSNIEQFLSPDPRFGKPEPEPRLTDPAKLRADVNTQANNEMFLDAFSPVVNTFSSIASTWGRFTDGCTTIGASICYPDGAKQHDAELAQWAQDHLDSGRSAAAEQLMRRELQFDISNFGFDAKETLDTAKRLRAVDQSLHLPTVEL